MASRMANDVGSSHCTPNVIVPRQSRETFNPVRPSRVCSMTPASQPSPAHASAVTVPLVERVLFDGIVRTDYRQFDIVWSDDGGFDGNFDRFFDGQENGLVGAVDPDGVYLVLAGRYGG